MRIFALSFPFGLIEAGVFGSEPDSMSEIVRKPSGIVNLLGQSFHASVAGLYSGLGILVGAGLSGGESSSSRWAKGFGLLLFFASLTWMVVTRKRAVELPR